MITKSMSIGEIIQKCQGASDIMMRYGLHCIGCHISTWESLEDGCRGHGLSDGDIDKLVTEINEACK